MVRGLYRFREAPSVAGARKPPRATILASGSIMQEALKAQTLLAERLGVAAEVWSATSYQLLRADALEIERWNRLHPGEPARVPFVAEQLAEPAAHGPVVAVSDFMKAVPDQIARWVPGDSWTVLGTDGFGRSDTRAELRRFFEIDAAHIAQAVVAELARCGRLDAAAARQARESLGVDAEAPYPPAG